MYVATVVLSPPNDVTICEGRRAVFTCKFTTTDTNISIDDVQWYRLMKDTSTTVMVESQDSNIHLSTSNINNTLTSSLTITSTTKSYAGYYWVRLPSDDDVCNVSLTVGTSMQLCK